MPFQMLPVYPVLPGPKGTKEHITPFNNNQSAKALAQAINCKN